MTTAEEQLYLDAAGLEFDALCARIVTDGRDPSTVAHGMKTKLARRLRELRELRQLWDGRLTTHENGEG